MTIGILMNPHAGARRWRRWSPRHLRKRLGESVDIAETASLDEVPDALVALRDRGIDTLVPFGGDGTVSRVLTAATGVWGEALPPVYLVRGGTINMIANSLGMPRIDPVRALRRLIEEGLAVTATRRLMCADAGAVGFTFGFGAPVEFLRHYDGGGVTGALGLIARAALSLGQDDGVAARLFAPVSLHWVADEVSCGPTEMRLLLAMTIDELSLGFRVAPGAGADGAAMHLIHGSVSPGFVVRHLRAFHAGEKVTGPGLFRARHAALEFVFDEPTSWMMDGDIYPPQRHLQLRLGPWVSFRGHA